MRIATCIAVLALVTLPTYGHAQSSQNSEETCAALFVAANYERAAIKCQLEADMGDTQSELLIGMLYQTGNAVTADASEAIKYLSRAAEKGHAFAAYRLAQIHFDGTIMRPDYPQSRKWLGRAIEGDLPEAMDMLGLMYWQGIGGLEKDPFEAFALFERAAELDLPMSMVNLGVMYFSGQGVAQDLRLAHSWIQKAAERGNGKAIAFLESTGGRALMQSASQGGETVINVSPGEIRRIYEIFHNMPLEDSAKAAEALEETIHEFPTYFIYELARRKGWSDNEEGAVWFWVGAIRLRYDVLRCVDSTAQNGMRTVTQVVQDTLGEYFKTGAQRAPAVIEAAFQKESKFPLDTDPSWICSHGARVTNMLLKRRLGGEEVPMEEIIKPKDEWPAIHDEALALVRSSLEK
jgi:TPR repeat protein